MTRYRTFLCALSVWLGITTSEAIQIASAQRGSGSSELAGAPVDSQAAAAQVKQDVPAAMDLIWAFKIPMRDGIRLNGTVFSDA